MNNWSDRKKKFVVWGAGLAGLSVAAPVIWMAVSGLIGLITAAAIVAAALAAAPVASSALGTWKIKGLKFIAARDPIEELQKDHARQETALEKMNQEIINAAAEANFFDLKKQELAAEYPEEVPQFEEDSKLAHASIATMRLQHTLAQQDLEDYWKVIKKAEAVYKMALAQERLNKAVGNLTGNAMDRVRRETAIDAVQRKVSQSRATLEQTVLSAKNQKRGSPVKMVTGVSKPIVALPLVEEVPLLTPSLTSPEKATVKNKFTPEGW